MIKLNPLRLRTLVLACILTTSIAAASTPPASAQRAAPIAPDIEALARQHFPSDERKAPATRLVRLTRDQLDTSIAALLPGYGIKSIKSAIARDPLQTNYEYAELVGLNAVNMAGLTTWITGIARRVGQNPAGAIKCGAADETCLRAQATSFITKAFRGDITPERLTALVEFYLTSTKEAGFAQATADLVEVVLNSPSFLFRKEIDTVSNDRLSPAQLLQAVTYTIADAPPDAVTLSSANADQHLRTGADAATTIGDLIQSRAGRAKLQKFFKAWLEIREPSDFTISQSVFPEFKPAYATAMLTETHQFLSAQLSRPAPSLKDVMQTVTVDGEGSGEPAASDPIAAKLAEADTAARMGLLTMPAVLASHSGPTNSRPIKRGVFWARKVMCMEMEPPPKELHAKLYDMSGVTERHRIEQSTKGAACVGCHKIINPLGFFLESYDALGRMRTLDNGQPIDTSILIDFLGTPPTKTETAVDAVKVLTASAMFQQCFVRQMFRFYMGRTEEPSDDTVLRRMFVTLAAGNEQDIFKTLYALASSDRMVRRR